MATLVLGAVGAGLGAIGGGFTVMQGLQWGMAVGSLIDGVTAPRPETGRLSDLRYSGSAYGSGIPRVWGRHRVPGNVLWIAEDEDGNHLIEHGGGGGGGGCGNGGAGEGATYTSSFMVGAAASGVIVRDTGDPDGAAVIRRNARIRRAWADSDVVYHEDEEESVLAEVGRFYRGGPAQGVDPLIEAAEGTGNAPAYLHWVSFVAEDFDVTAYGRIPNWSIEVETDPVTLADVLSDLLRSAGVPPSRFDVSAGAGVPVAGFALFDPQSVDAAITQLCQAFDFELTELDGRLRVAPRATASLGRIPPEHLGARSGDGEGSGVLYTATYRRDEELPDLVVVSFYSATRDYQSDTVQAWRGAGGSGEETSLGFTLALTTGEAERIARREIDRRHIESVAVTFDALPDWAHLAPGDVVDLPLDAGDRRVRITRAALNRWGEAKFEGLVVGPSVGEQDPPPDDAPPAEAGAVVPAPSLWRAWSGPELREEDTASPGFYVAATGGSGWLGGRIYYSSDGGATWVAAEGAARRATFGVTTTALPAGLAGSGGGETVGVDLSASSGALTGTPPSALEAGQGFAVIAGEIVGVGTASPTGTYGFTLGNLVRGGRRTAPTDAPAGSLFVRADDAVVRVPVATSLVGLTILVKVVSRYQAPTDVAGTPVVIAPARGTLAQRMRAALLAQVWVTETEVAAGTTAVPWTTYDPDLPEGAAEVTLFVTAHTDADVGPTMRILARPSAVGPELRILDTGAGDREGGYSSQIRLPLSPAGTFDLRVDGDFEEGWSVAVQGYGAPVG